MATISVAEHDEIMAARARILRVLLTEMTLRHSRPGPVDGEPAWVVYERSALREVVSDIRREHSRQPVTSRDIAALEERAVGHADYAEKLAFYCAQLARGHLTV